MAEIIQKVYDSSKLMHPTTIYINGPGMLFNADAIVLGRLYELIRTNPASAKLYGDMFPTVVDELKESTVHDLYLQTQNKTSANILYDLVDWKVCKEKCGTNDMFMYLDKLYDIILYELDMKDDCTYHGTTIGYAIKSLLNDRYLRKVYIYLQRSSKWLIDEISKMFQSGSDKLELLTHASPQYAILESHADEYFLTKLSHVDTLRMVSPPNRKKRVYIPMFPYNMASEKEIEGMEKEYQAYNINVCYIRVPF